MPPAPPSDATHTTGHAGRRAIAGSDLELTFTTRGDVGELELGGIGPVELVAAAVGAVDAVRTAHPEVAFHLAADHPVDVLDPLPEALADAAGLPHRRDLLQLRRQLPVPPDHPSRRGAPPVALRPIDLEGHGRPDLAEDDPDIDRPWDDPDGWPPDVGAWLRVNNRAFADHPDQGAETVETLVERRRGEPDDAGFLVADDPARPGELSGFCWTKVHPATDEDPELGEIYVIGVDPSHRGEGLGVSFVLGGLDHLASRGIGTANLYVEADNEPALRLYDRLGFTAHQRRRVYTA
ncbi:GNAT family N-acetyltransferase [Aquihabitans sp. G128]|uniref:GNAT family N-acetyltransferase n=1 Tax=Aquihabitans sp. G128 TaxID=2849779 RepID=UPI001C21077D|nr:GNAT family N-acetyltransferase [Aquihabitans sp. G128]QXC62568.1 GNAT family N-acetyltransferase [Aquihabitans sp. G128]